MSRLLQSPVWLGLGVLFVGFFAMLMLWLFGGFVDHPRGLFSFLSATWGDGLCLPLMAGALALLNRRMTVPPSLVLRRTAAIIGAGVGALTQLVWWLDPNPGLNWSLPAPHNFNTPGIVHALFFVLASSLFSVLWVDFFYRLRKTFRQDVDQGREHLRSGALALALGTAGAFACLAALDSAGSGFTQAGASSVFALVIASTVLAGGLVWAAREHVPQVILTALTAVIVGFAVVELARKLPFDAVIISLVVAAAGFGTAVGMTGVMGSDGTRRRFERARASPVLETLAIPALFLLVPVQAGMTKSAADGELLRVLLWLGGVLLLSMVFRVVRRGTRKVGDDKQWLFISGVFLLITCGALTFSRMGPLDSAGVSTSFAFAVLAAVLAGPAIRLCDRDLQVIIKIEQTDEFRENDAPSAAQRPVINRLYLRLGVCLLAAGSSVLGLTVLTGYAVGWIRGGDGIELGYWELVFLGVAGISTVALATMTLIPGIRHHVAQLAAGRELICVLVSISALGLVLGVATSGAPVDLWAGAQSLVIALFAGECILGNGLRLGLVKPVKASHWMLGCSTAGVWAAAYWSLTEGVDSPGGPVLLGWSFLALAVTLAVVGLFVFSVTTSIFGRTQTGNRPHDQRAGNALQDFVLLAVMWSLMAWLPQVIAAHIPDQEVTAYKWVMVGMVFVGFLSLYITALFWLIETNDGHVQRQTNGAEANAMSGADADDGSPISPTSSHWTRLTSTKRRMEDYFRNDEADPDEVRKARALSGHTAIQNVLALSLVVITFAGALWLSVTDWEP